MAEHQPTHKKSDPSPSPVSAMMPGSTGEYAAPLDLSLLATGRNHKGILQLQRTIGNRTTRQLLQREGGPASAAAGPVVAPAADKIDPLTVVLDDVEYQTAKAIYETNPNWNALKAIYMESEEKDLRQMANLWAFRRAYVVNLIKSLRSTKYPNLLAKSAGSNDLSSDYDITLASPGNDNDVKAIEDFNNKVKADFGVQPGTLFDTNLYAKDYGAISQSKEFEEDGLVAAKDSAPGETADMLQMEYDVQDVAALLKLRRFMNQTEWDAYVADMLENIDEDKQAAVQRKYDEADGIYHICVSTLLGQVREALGEEEEEVELEHAQEENAEQLHEATESHSDTVLEQSNALYLARMSRIRSIQAHTTELETQYAALEALGNVTPALAAMVEAHFQNPNKDLPARIEAERTQVKQLLAEAIYFAAEAYISQGAIRHVVAGIQGTKLSDDEKKANPGEDAQKALMKKKLDAANAKLDMSDLQQSFNEQLGDFLKDYQHLADASDGKFYIKSSKYIDRMFDVVLILKGRMGADFPEALRIEGVTGKTFTEIVAAIKELYSARGDPNKWGAARETTSTGIMRDRMGVASRGQLKAVLLGLGSEISALLRNQSPAAADRATESSFFQNRNTAFD